MAKAQKPTINDVARLSGVSKKTVSRVINKSPLLNQATREKVEAVIAQLDYVPNPQARALALRRNFLIGLSVDGTQEMHDAVLSAVERADALLMAAAVADYRPAEATPQKIKKEKGGLTLDLIRTPDTLSAVAQQRAEVGYPRLVVGFAAESENLVENARAKLEAKRLDLIVANDVTAPDAGFGVETNRVVLIGRDGSVEELPLMSKGAVAEAILERVVRLLVAVEKG